MGKKYIILLILLVFVSGYIGENNRDFENKKIINPDYYEDHYNYILDINTYSDNLEKTYIMKNKLIIYFKNNITTSDRAFAGCRGTCKSMLPSSDKNDIEILHVPKSPDEIKIGTIISVRRDDGDILTHRVIKIEDNKYYTRGDANLIADKGYVEFEDILYIVCGVIYK